MIEYPKVWITFAAGVLCGLSVTWLYVGWRGDHVIASEVATASPPDTLFDDQHDQLAHRKPDAMLKVPWASRVDIQLGAHEQQLDHVEQQLNAEILRSDALVKRVHDLELVDRCRKEKP